MSDKREAIMERLLAIAQGIDGVSTAARNVVDFDDTRLPAVGVLEGDEEVSDADADRTRPSNRPQIITALPQVFIRATGDDAGTTLNALRAALIKAILADAQLAALTMNGRGVRYNGAQSTLHAARSMAGATALVFAITYLLNPADL